MHNPRKFRELLHDDPLYKDALRVGGKDAQYVATAQQPLFVELYALMESFVTRVFENPEALAELAQGLMDVSRVVNNEPNVSGSLG